MFRHEIIANMVIGERLRALRERAKLTQQDIEDRTGLKRCYLSRVENGSTVPSIHTLEKLASALNVPMYRLFHEGEGSLPDPPPLAFPRRNIEADAKANAEVLRMLSQMAGLWAKLDASSRERLFSMARLMADRRRSKAGNGKPTRSVRKISRPGIKGAKT